MSKINDNLIMSLRNGQQVQKLYTRKNKEAYGLIGKFRHILGIGNTFLIFFVQKGL